MDSLKQNPFSVQTPEGMSASETIELFVDLFSDYPNVEKSGHTFLHGPRGSGKSMLFRFMAPDCQTLSRKVHLSALPYLGVYASIKATDLNLSEFARLKDKFAELILAEHAMVVFFGAKTLLAVSQAISVESATEERNKEILSFCSSIRKRLKQAGWHNDNVRIDSLDDLIPIFDELYSNTVSYLRAVAFTGNSLPYSGVLLGFHDFLLPLFSDLMDLRCMPNGPVFLMVDDADNLSEKQTEVLNTWVSSRSTKSVCLKIASQMTYKTFRTVNGGRIEAPHDFSEVNIGSIYTSTKDRYQNWVHEIVAKRLSLANIAASPEEFFPEEHEQEKAINAIAQDIKKTWPELGKGYRPNDDAYRYARPEYIKGLKGTTKQGSTYRYAGFNQIVHISSGVIRHFLEAASLMYGEQKKRLEGQVVCIEPLVQHQVLKDLANSFMMDDFDRMAQDEQSDSSAIGKVQRLKNLVSAVGGMFHKILVSDMAERRVFSFALSDAVDNDVKNVLDLGVQYGYFYESTIGNKESTGRTRLYVLSRRVAPFFLLDPTGFSGYKFVTNSFLREAMLRPKTTLSRIDSQGLDAAIQSSQGDLFGQE